MKGSYTSFCDYSDGVVKVGDIEADWEIVGISNRDDRIAEVCFYRSARKRVFDIPSSLNPRIRNIS